MPLIRHVRLPRRHEGDVRYRGFDRLEAERHAVPRLHEGQPRCAGHERQDGAAKDRGRGGRPEEYHGDQPRDFREQH